MIAPKMTILGVRPAEVRVMAAFGITLAWLLGTFLYDSVSACTDVRTREEGTFANSMVTGLPDTEASISQTPSQRVNNEVRRMVSLVAFAGPPGVGHLKGLGSTVFAAYGGNVR